MGLILEIYLLDLYLYKQKNGVKMGNNKEINVGLDFGFLEINYQVHLIIF
jgi:hypothetical protein